jgi:hypothetical protein
MGCTGAHILLSLVPHITQIRAPALATKTVLFFPLAYNPFVNELYNA